MTLLDIPTWFYGGALSVAGTAIGGLIWVIIWFVKRYVSGIDKVLDRNTSAIESLDTTMLKMSNNFEKYQASNDGHLTNVEQMARRAERQSKENETQLADHEGRIGIIETKCKINHKA